MNYNRKENWSSTQIKRKNKTQAMAEEKYCSTRTTTKWLNQIDKMVPKLRNKKINRIIWSRSERRKKNRQLSTRLAKDDTFVAQCFKHTYGDSNR